jgi:hypothetical protein
VPYNTTTMELMSDLFGDELLGVIAHWQDEHPSSVIWFVDYDDVVLAMSYRAGNVWPLEDVEAIRLYFPDDGQYRKVDEDELVIWTMLERLTKWAKARPEFAEIEDTSCRKAAVFLVEDDGFSFSIFDHARVH